MRIVRSNKNKYPIAKNYSNYNSSSHQPKYDDQELRAMQRSPKRQKPATSLISFLAEKLFWENFDHR